MIATKIKSFFIRQAEPDDVPLILAFVKDLAAYEKLSHEVVATEALLEETLFGERRTAEVLIGEYQGTPAAFALFFHNFSTFLGRPGIYLEDLFVKPSFRGKGLGKCAADSRRLATGTRISQMVKADMPNVTASTAKSCGAVMMPSSNPPKP